VLLVEKAILDLSKIGCSSKQGERMNSETASKENRSDLVKSELLLETGDLKEDLKRREFESTLLKLNCDSSELIRGLEE
jgi:hypothetical protein